MLELFSAKNNLCHGLVQLNKETSDTKFAQASPSGKGQGTPAASIRETGGKRPAIAAKTKPKNNWDVRD